MAQIVEAEIADAGSLAQALPFGLAALIGERIALPLTRPSVLLVRLAI